MKPWKKLEQRVQKINRHRSLLRVKYRLPNQSVQDFYLTIKPRVVAALVVTKDKTVILAKQFRLGQERMLMELPGGAVDAQETPRQAVIREVLEETGYRGRVHFLARSSNDAWSTLVRYHFVVTGAKKVAEAKPDMGEAIEVVAVSRQQLKTYLDQGRMMDGETAYRALEYLGWR